MCSGAYHCTCLTAVCTAYVSMSNGAHRRTCLMAVQQRPHQRVTSAPPVADEADVSRPPRSISGKGALATDADIGYRKESPACADSFP